MMHVVKTEIRKDSVILYTNSGEKLRLMACRDDIVRLSMTVSGRDFEPSVTGILPAEPAPAPFTAEEISRKMAEMLRPEGVQTEIVLVFQSLEGLHKACPNSPGDWYFSGHYPTPGGNMRVNKAYIDFYEKNIQQ